MPDERPSSNLATLAILYREPEVAVLVSMLRAYGVAAFVPTWYFATMSWNLTVAIGGIAVMVPAADVDKAIFLVGDPAELPLPRRNFRGGPFVNMIMALGLFFCFGLPMPARAKGCYARAAEQEQAA